MNKKIIASGLLATSLLLSSCGAPKELGTFEAEMKAQQTSYSQKIEKSMGQISEFTKGKFTQKWDIDVKVTIPKIGNADFKVTTDAKSSISDSALAMDAEMVVDAKATAEKKIDEPMLANIQWATGTANAKVSFGFVDSVLYGNIESLTFDAKGSDQLNALVKDAKTKFDFGKGMFVNKWFSFELPEELQKEFQQALMSNTQSVAMLKDLAPMMFSGDIFTNVEETQYKGQKAYKFEIDEQKAAKHFANVFKTINEKYWDILEPQLKAQGVTKEQFQEGIKKMEEEANNPENFKEKKHVSELYMTRAKDGGVNIYMPTFHPVDKKKEEANLSISLVENTMDLVFVDNDITLSLKTTNKNGTITFTGEVQKDKKTMGKVEGEYNAKISSSDIKEKVTMNLTLSENENGGDPVSKNGLKVDVTLNSLVKKDEKVKITKEEITNKATEITNLEALLGGMIGGMLPSAMNDNSFSIENDEEGMDDEENEENEDMNEEDDEMKNMLDEESEETEEKEESTENKEVAEKDTKVETTDETKTTETKEETKPETSEKTEEKAPETEKTDATKTKVKKEAE